MRIAVTVGETSPGNWVVVAGPDGDVAGQKAVVDDMAANSPGDNRLLILSTSGVLKKTKVALSKPKKAKSKKD